MKSTTPGCCANPRSFRSPKPQLAAIALAGLFGASGIQVADAAVGFSAHPLQGLVSGGSNKAHKVTSLQFGPDNRLYFTQVNGTIIACDVVRAGPGNYQASNIETIDLVKGIPNYDDDGNRNFSLNARQATGILVLGTAQNPVLYVTSSDPREGAGSGAVDSNLDTNSGVISRLTRNASGAWEKVDIVRGLPRSEENHACNGLNIDATGTILYLAQGGNTNAGGPSNNFAFACETALAAAVLSIDLTAINAMPVQTDAYGQQFIYDLPTLNDPNPDRSVNPDGSNFNDPFGGNDGLNQAKLVEGGPVQVYASGFRNPYDVLIAQTPGRVGNMYTFDNAANSGWGGYPANNGVLAGNGASLVTNEYPEGEPGTVNNKDGLHLIPGPGYYGGHPNPIRANPSGAGWFRNDEGGEDLVFSLSPTSDWPPVPPSMADPRQGEFHLPGPASGALLVNSASTTGIAEYTAANFDGEMVGDLLVTQYNTATVQRITLNADGTAVTGSSVILSGTAFGTPLDVTCPGPGAAPELWGTIFVGHHSSKITILEPTDFDSGGSGGCSGIYSFTIDEDNDGYSNADELLNESDPCSPAVTPPDWDGDFLSDLLDSDDDNDGLSDTQDPFPIDPVDGMNVAPPVRRELFNELGIGFFSIGFNGVMLKSGVDYSQMIDEEPLIAGGTAGLFTDPAVGPGNPHGASNSQINAFHFGVNIDELAGPYLFRSGLGGLLFNNDPTGEQSQGVFIGNGDQDNYVKVAVNAASGAGAIEVVHEEDGQIISQTLYPDSGILTSGVPLSLYFLVDPVAGTIHPGYSFGGGEIVYVGDALAVGGEILNAIRGPSAVAFGLLATTGDEATPTFNATWDFFEVLPISGTAAAKLTVNSNAGSLVTSSTNTTGSFQLENLSTGGQKIVSVSVDLGTALLPDIVFDPDGTAGDLDGKGFNLDSFSGAGTPTGTFEAPHDGIGGQDGYRVLRVDCGPGVDFGPGDLLTFSSDVDPLSVKGSLGPGPVHAASVSGLELIGATITVAFDDGTVRKVRNTGITGTPSTNKTSLGILSSDRLPTPALSVPGKTTPFVTATQPTVRVAGPSGSEAKVWVFHTALHLDDGVIAVPGGGYQIDPYETNAVVAYNFTTVAIGEKGFVDVPLTLTYSETLGGINQIAAVLVDSEGRRSSSSEILTIEYDPTFTPATALIRVNAGGGTYVDSSGNTWSADTGYTSGGAVTYDNPIAGTTDDALYQSFRYGISASDPLDYVFSVPNGWYEVRLHFAETWSGVTGPGERVFDVLLEDELVLDDYDIFAVAGPNTARTEAIETTVADGQLTIGLRHVVQNPMISAIEIFQLGTIPPDTEPPSAPGVLVYSNLKAGSVTLDWSPSTDNVGVTGYRVFRDEIELGETSSTSFADAGLDPSTVYNYAVEAYDLEGNVSEQALLTVTTPADQEDPTMPGSLKGVAGNGLAQLSWVASTDDAGVTGYHIYRDGDLVATVAGLSYTDSGLTNGTVYAYQVVAFDASGKSSAPAEVTVRPRALGPAVLRVNCGGADYVDLSGNTWLADFGFNTGVAEISTGEIAGTEDDALYQSRRFDRSHGAELKYSFPLADGEYELRLHFAEVWSGGAAPGIRVFDVLVENQLALQNFDIFAAGGFATALSVPLPVTVSGGQLTIEFLHLVQNPTVAAIEVYALEGPPPDEEAPSQPTGLAVTGTTAGSVSLSWTAASDNVAVTAYEVSRDGSPVGTVSGTSFTDIGLTADTLYQYSLVALDAAGNASAPTDPVAANTLPDVTPPSMPGSLAGTAGNGVVELSWTASVDDSSIAGYEVWRDSTLLDTVASTAYTDAGLVNGTIYHYQVIAIDSVGNTSAPAAVSVAPRALGPVFLRVNVGSVAEFVDSEGNAWDADFGYNTGYSETTTNEISGTAIPAIYQTRRIDRSSGAELKYQFTVPDGDYEVRLHFAEVWSGAFATGIRVFDVSVEGALVLDDLDIFAEVGANTAFVAAIPVTIADGQLNIDFQRVVQNPNLSGIEVYPLLGSGDVDVTSPSAPGSLAATEVGLDGATLAWTPSSDDVGVTGYRVYRDASLVGTVTEPGFSESGLTSGTEYIYDVVAFDMAGNVSAPASLGVTTLVPDAEAPSTPANLVAVAGWSHVVLTWDASTDNVEVAGYLIIRNGEMVMTVETTGYTDTGLASGTEYDYEVLALDAIGNTSAPAQSTTSTLVDSEPPTTPANFTADPGAATMSLSWSVSTDNAGVIGYQVFRGAEWVATVQETSFEESGLVPGTAYSYSVIALDAAGNSSVPATLDTATFDDTESPGAPPALTAVASDQSVQLAWQAATDDVGVATYEIRRAGVPIATVSTLGYEDAGLTNGVTYFYEVRAIDFAGNLSPAATASATPRELGAVIARINAGGSAFQDAAGNDWFEDFGFNSGATSISSNPIAETEDDVLYQSERFDGSPGGLDLEYGFPVANGTYEVRLHFAETWSGITAPGQRVFDVYAEGNLEVAGIDIFARAGANTATVVSLPVTVADSQLDLRFGHVVQNPKVCGIEIFEIISPPTESEPPTVPTDLLVAEVTGNSASLTWTASTDNVGVTGYRVYRDGELVATVEETAFAESALASGTAYDYAVTAIDAADNESSPATVTATTLAPDAEAPSQPADLVAVPGLVTVSLTWTTSTDNLGVTGYEIYRDSVLLATVADLTFEDSGLIPATSYTYEVIALDAAGNASAAAAVGTTTLEDTEAPTAPPALTALAGDGSVELVWQAATDNTAVAGYEIRRDGIVLTTVTPTGHIDTGLTNGTTYLYEVRTIDVAGNLSAPAAVSATPLAIGAAVVRVNAGGPAFLDSAGNYWRADQGFNGGATSSSGNAIAGTDDDALYQTERFDSSAAGSDLEYAFTVADGSYEVRLHFAETWSGITAAGQRVFDVYAEQSLKVDGLDIFALAGSNTATVVSFPVTVADGQLDLRFDHLDIQNPKICAIEVFEIITPPAESEPPTVPADLLVAEVTGNSASLTWTASTDNVGVTGYRVYRDGVLVATVEETAFAESGLASGTAYDYAVTAIDAAGNESSPATVTATTLAPDVEAPSQPGSLVATPGYDEVALAWDSSTDNIGVTGYEVYRDSVLLATVTELTFGDSGLIPGTAYNYEVIALDAAGNASAAAAVGTTTLEDSTAPAAPPALTALAGDGSVELIWQAGTDDIGVAGYEIRRDGVLLTTVAAPGHVDTGLSNGTAYLYEVRTFDLAGNLSAAATASATPREVGPAVVRVNAGGLAFLDSAGNNWLADQGFNGGSTSTNGNAIAGTTDDALYQTDRFDSSAAGSDLEYAFVVVNGSYEVRLHFAETFAGITAPGQRVFDIYAEQNLVVDNLDIFARAGSNRALAVSFPVTVADGQLNLRLDHLDIQNPKVCAIEILEVVGEPVETQPGTPGDLAVVEVTQNSVSLSWTAPAGGVEISGYQVSRDGAPVETVTHCSFSESGLASGVEYEYAVTTLAGDGSQSEPATVVVATLIEDDIAPAQPANLAAVPGHRTVSLTWDAATDNIGVTGYEVYRDSVLLATVTELTFGDSGLIPGTAYTYGVIALDAAGNASAAAATATATLEDSTAPAAPPALTALAGDGSVELIWQAGTDDIGVAGYEIRRGGVLLTTVAVPGHVDTGLSNGTAYLYEVRTFDLAGNLSAAATASATPREVGPAVVRVNAGGLAFLDSAGNNWLADQGFNASGTFTSGNAIAGTTDDALYQTERFDSSSSGSDLEFAHAVANGSYEVRLHFAETFAGITAPGQRVFDVYAEQNLAVDNMDIFARAGTNRALVVSFPVTVADGQLDLRLDHLAIQNPKVCGIEIFGIVSPPAESEPPTVPADLVVAEVTGNSASLTWTASTDNVGVTGYRVYRDAALVATVEETAFAESGLASGTAYDYAVTAIDAAGNESSPATVTATTLVPDVEAPGQPASLVATPGYDEVALAWDPSTDNVGVTAYRVYRDSELLTTVGSPGHTDSGLASGVELTYEVTAIDSAGNESSAALVVTTTLVDVEAPAQPANLAAVPGHTTVSLTWDAATDNIGVTGYEVYRDSVLLATVTELTFGDSGLIPGTAYTYGVIALDAAGNASAAAATATATLEDSTAPAAPPALTALAGDGSVELIWQAGTDDIGVAGYEIRRGGVLLTTVAVPGHVDTGLSNGTAYLYEVRTFDLAGNLSAAATASATPREVGPAVVRVNAGGLAFLDSAGNNWLADQGFNASGTFTSGNAIAGTTDDALYQTERFDSSSSGSDLEFAHAVANGSYEVRLHFAETFAGITAPGQRVFDVYAEQNLAVDNMDIFARAGTNRALVVSFPVTVADGQLDLRLDHLAIQNPKVCGIEIFGIVSPPAESEPPTVPADLVVAEVTGNSASLTWTASTDNVGVTGYRVYRDAALVATVEETAFAESGLASGTAYDYAVTAIDAAGNESSPATVTATTLAPDVEAPGQPASLVATPGYDEVALAWDPSTDNVGVTAYRVYRDSELLTTVGSPGHTDSGLASGVELTYEVTAIDSAGNESSAALVVTTTLVDVEAPAQPANLAAVPGHTTVSLTWDAATDNIGVTGYEVYRDSVLLATVTELTFGDSGLIPGTAYTYGVIALDAAGNASAAAATATATLEDSTAPAAPPALTALAGDGSVELIWQAGTDDIGVAGYEIRRGGVLLTTVAAPGHVDTGLSNGTAYLYEVRTFDLAGNLSAAATASATPREVGPAVVRVNAGGLAFLDSAGNNWLADQGFNASGTFTSGNAIAGTTDDALYQTERFDSSSSGSDLEFAHAVANGSYEVRLHFAETFAGITAPGQRVFDVYAEQNLAVDNMDIFARAGSNRALVVSFPVAVADGQLNLRLDHLAIQNPKVCGIEIFGIVSPPAESEPPTVPADLLVAEVTGNSASLTWTASTDNVGVTGYRVYRDAALVATVEETAFAESGLASGTAYDYAVTAIDAAGNESSPATVTATTLAPDVEAPGQPASLVATPGYDEVALAWDPSTDNVGVTAYRVYRDSELLTTVGSPGHTDSGLASGVELTYEVTAIDSAGNESSAALVVTTTLVDVEAPAQPANLAAVPGHTTVSLTWDAATDNIGVTGYEVYRDSVLLATVTELTFGDSGLIPGTAYTYGVIALDAAGNASTAATVGTTTLEDSTAPAAPPALTALAGDGSVELVWQAGTDDIGVAGYEIRRGGVLLTTVAVPGHVDTGLSNGNAYLYEVRTFDLAGNLSAAATASATPREVGPAVVRVNAGGLAFLDSAGNNWLADQGFNASGTFTSGNAIAGTTDDALYQTERFDSSSSGSDLEFAHAVANGSYEVRLHFAETFAGITAPGQRVFDVYAEQNLAVDNLDIFARAGTNRALVVSFPVAVADGQLNLRLDHLAIQNPKVCAIEILEIVNEVEAPPTFEEWLDANGLAGQTTGDSDKGGLDNLAEYELQLDPNDPLDDLSFRLEVTGLADTFSISFPELKPIGNYHLHRSNNLTGMENLANRIATVTRAEIEAMTPAERASYVVEDSNAGPRAFYQLIFEPVAE